MKTKLIMTGLLATTLWLPAQVITTNTYSLSLGSGIADGSPVGLTEQFNVNGLDGSIKNVQVSLDITGGFNGDLYAYLAGPQGQFAVLLNRAGITGSNPYGCSDAGFSITLDGLTGSNIHDYGSGYRLFFVTSERAYFPAVLMLKLRMFSITIFSILGVCKM